MMDLMHHLIFLMKTDDKLNELNVYKRRTVSKINTTNTMLEYLRILEDKLIDKFSTFNIIKIINHANYKTYVLDELKKNFDNEDLCHVEAILHSLKFQRLEKIKIEKPQETIAEKVSTRK